MYMNTSWDYYFEKAKKDSEEQNRRLMENFSMRFLSDQETKDMAINFLEELGYHVSLTKKETFVEVRGCPHCKSQDVRIEHDSPINLYQVVCKHCGLSSPKNVSKNTVVSWWKDLLRGCEEQ